jgi:hypothetical protein
MLLMLSVQPVFLTRKVALYLLLKDFVLTCISADVRGHRVVII